MKWALVGVVALASWGLFAFSSLTLRDAPRADKEDVLRVRLPLVLQLAQAGGDRFLAANFNSFRAIVVDTAVREPESFRVQGQLQKDAAFFNPYHADNYYLAAAQLPWNGQVEAAQEVLQKASGARHWDVWPTFFYAFNAMYFEKDMVKAAQWAEEAARRNPKNAPALRAMAAAWYERQHDSALALDVLRNLYAQATDANYRDLLAARIARLEGLIALRKALAEYRKAHQGALPPTGEALIGYGGLEALPDDPLGAGYRFDDQGELQIADHIKKDAP